MSNLKTEANARPLRCHCGNLLARLVPGGVELKCRRCKRTVVIPLQTDGPEIERGRFGPPSEDSLS